VITYAYPPHRPPPHIYLQEGYKENRISFRAKFWFRAKFTFENTLDVELYSRELGEHAFVQNLRLTVYQVADGLRHDNSANRS
jgi:hypothetical protein